MVSGRRCPIGDCNELALELEAAFKGLVADHSDGNADSNDLSVLIGAYWAAFLIRLDGVLAPRDYQVLLYTWPCVVALQFAFLACYEVPVHIWRYVGFFEVRRILFALLMASIMITTINRSAGVADTETFWGLYGRIPLGAIIIDFVLSLLGLSAVRGVTRFWHEHRKAYAAWQANVKTLRTLLIGAGSAGAGVAKVLGTHPELRIKPVGFLDDDPSKRGLIIHGIPVIGALTDLVTQAKRLNVQQALITMGEPSATVVRQVFQMCEACNVATKIIPGIDDLMAGKVQKGAIRDIDLEDLLRRAPVTLDTEAIAALVQNRKIIITGAGGSIGSELCRTICRFAPEILVLIEQAENSLFHIHRELIEAFPDIQILPCVADVGDQPRLSRLFTAIRPDVVIHAAAHKHVPMMEWNPGEAIKNNVLATRNIVDLTHEVGAAEFVLISTDKAVRPSCVMGASKQLAEIYVHATSRRSRTRFVTVRFGNVLGSAGSVIPIFKQQIAKGGPVTVTHPDMQRYFMTIPEASQLVLQAASMGKGGEIFILDMGEPVKIVELARNLIRLSGFTPEEISIQFTGTRPGENYMRNLLSRRS